MQNCNFYSETSLSSGERELKSQALHLDCSSSMSLSSGERELKYEVVKTLRVELDVALFRRA